MRAAAAAVLQQLVVRTAGVLQRVGKDRQVVEAPALVDSPGELDERAAPPRQPRRGHRGTARAAGNVAEQGTLSLLLGASDLGPVPRRRVRGVQARCLPPGLLR